MVDRTNGSNAENCVSAEEGKDLADRFFSEQKGDPYPDIPPALLSARHIKAYVMKTGMMSPFDATDDARRLKKASYEGRMGEHAYWYDNKEGKLNCCKVDCSLTVPENSIVFVESDIDFRLPDFIAMRFNLQIRHVHRGLLLGTGPLVDPGYWGKLCIPLHNLTHENYVIPKEEGLVWLEFTKISNIEFTKIHDSYGVFQVPLDGRLPLDVAGPQKGYWNIRDYIEKAARPFGEVGKAASIQSSIPFATQKAKDAAEKARADAETAKSEAKNSSQSAMNASRSSEKIANNIQIFGGFALFGLLVALVAHGSTVYSNIQDAYNVVLPQANSAREEAIRNSKDIERMESEMERMSIQIRNLIDKNNRLVEDMRMLRESMQTDPDANVGDHYPLNTDTSAGDHE